MKVLFQFTVDVAPEKAQRATAAVLQRLAQFVAVDLPKDFPSLEGKGELLEATVVLQLKD